MKHLKSFIKIIFPKKYHNGIFQIYRKIYGLYFVGHRFFCPICDGHFRKFLPFGVKSRENASCPRCNSLERHRLLWLYLKNRTKFFIEDFRVLHVAPMRCLWEKFRRFKNLDYITADISSRDEMAMVKTNINDICFRDNQFDCIICYHVLEHISDDVKAMKELYRVLKPNGWAILQSGVDKNRDRTFEDYNITTPRDREKIFGQKDHCRIYGLDYKERLERSGFTVKPDYYFKELDTGVIKKFRLEDEIIYFCKKE